MSTFDRQFGGGWDAPAWPPLPDDFPQKLKKGRRAYQVAARLVPARSRSLTTFAQALSEAVDFPIGLPAPEHRSVMTVHYCSAKSPQAALSIIDFALRRALKRAGLRDHVASIAFDVRLAPSRSPEGEAATDVG